MKSQSMESEKVWNAREQCRAVLSVWMERRSLEGACRDLKVSRKVMMQWQERAMSGMMRALSPRNLRDERRPALAVMVRRLVERQAAGQEGMTRRLARRLATVKEDREQAVTPAPAAR